MHAAIKLLGRNNLNNVNYKPKNGIMHQLACTLIKQFLHSWKLTSTFHFHDAT